MRVLSHHSLPTTCTCHVVRLSMSASCALSLPPVAHSRAIPSFPRRSLSSATHSRCLQLLSARSRLSSALAGCRITTSCDAAASHPSALLPLACRRLCLSLHCHPHCAAAPPHLASYPCIIVKQRRRPLRRDVGFSNVSISSH